MTLADQMDLVELEPCDDCISRETVKQLYYKDGYIAFSKIECLML